MADDLLILHNPRCSTSRAAVGTCEAGDLGVEANVRNYLLDPLDAQEWAEVIEILEDPLHDLVRRDKNFTESGLTEADIQTPAQVAEVLAKNPILAQRPVLIRGGKAIIGRPKDRVGEFLAAQ